MSLPPVSDLTDESDGEKGPIPSCSKKSPRLPPVSALSDSDTADDGSLAPGAKRKRKRVSKKADSDGVTLRDRLCSEETLVSLVGKNCKRCRGNCLHHFQQVSQFRELQRYRAHWSELHKTDQDQYAF